MPEENSTLVRLMITEHSGRGLSQIDPHLAKRMEKVFGNKSFTSHHAVVSILETSAQILTALGDAGLIRFI